MPFWEARIKRITGWGQPWGRQFVKTPTITWDKGLPYWIGARSAVCQGPSFEGRGYKLGFRYFPLLFEPVEALQESLQSQLPRAALPPAAGGQTFHHWPCEASVSGRSAYNLENLGS